MDTPVEHNFRNSAAAYAAVIFLAVGVFHGTAKTTSEPEFGKPCDINERPLTFLETVTMDIGPDGSMIFKREGILAKDRDGNIWETRKTAKDANAPIAFFLKTRASQTATAPAEPEANVPKVPGNPPATQEPKKSLTIDLGSGVTMEFVWCPPGEFTMGSPANERDRMQTDEPQHRMTLTKGFYIGKYEVTQRQWEKMMGSNPSELRKAGEDAPVDSVSWSDCEKFISKLNSTPNTESGAVPRKSGMQVRFCRLPTETEWEYACRAGASGVYGGNLDEMAWYEKNSGSTKHPVGQRKPNAWGLYDMHGNVWEWCHGWCKVVGGSFERPRDATVDPTDTVSKSVAVLRGGSWGHNAVYCRTVTRWCFGPLYGRYVGLRVVLVVR